MEKKIFFPLARKQTPSEPIGCVACGPWSVSKAARGNGTRGRDGARRCRGYTEARVQTRKRPGEAAPRALREEAPLGPLRSGSDWAMESMSELAPRCLLLPLLLLPLLLLPAPKLGPSSAGAEETDWVRLPSKCEVCKYVAVELKSAFEETGKTKEVIDTGYGILDRKASGVKYTKS